MTEEEREDEGTEEAIEDLEAPAQAQDDVAGGAGCVGPTCGKPSLRCESGTCVVTEAMCTPKSATRDIVVYEQ